GPGTYGCSLTPGFSQVMRQTEVAPSRLSGFRSYPDGCNALERAVNERQRIFKKSKLARRSLNAASPRMLCPSTDACQPSVGCNSSARLRSAVANASEYRS